MKQGWCAFFRIPNLPSLPGDPLAGAVLAALSLPLSPSLPTLLLLSAASILLYMGGLADNDLVDLERDRQDAPDRPLPSGAIPLKTAKAVRLATLAGGMLCGWAGGFHRGWFLTAPLLILLILLYNRIKTAHPLCGAWAMGGCRGLNLLCGATALLPAFPEPPVLIAAGGWTLYIAAVTLLGVGEHHARDPLPAVRYLPALLPFLPLLGILLFAGRLPSPSSPLFPLTGAILTALLWCRAVHPLGLPHTPPERGAAVGKTIRALMFLQAGIILLMPTPPLLVILLLCFCSRRLISTLFPSITGS